MSNYYAKTRGLTFCQTEYKKRKAFRPSLFVKHHEKVYFFLKLPEVAFVGTKFLCDSFRLNHLVTGIGNVF